MHLRHVSVGRRLGVLLTCCLVGGSSAVGAVGAAAASPSSRPAEPAEPHTSTAASAIADADLAALTVPTTATPTGSAAGPDFYPAEGPPIFWGDTMLVRTRWWSVPGTVAQVLDEVDARPPQGFMRSFVGVTDGTVTTDGYVRGGRNPSTETVLVSAAQDGDQVELRADAYVLWYLLRTGAETLPAGLHSATLSYLGPQAQSDPDPAHSAKPAHARVVLTGTVLHRIVADLNALAPVSPRTNCEIGGDGELARVRATVDGRRIVFSAPLTGCLSVDVSVDGHLQQPLLDGGSEQLTSDVYAAIGVRSTPIPQRPPQPALPRIAPPGLTLQAGPAAADRAAGRALAVLASAPVGAGAVRLTNPGPPPYTGTGRAVVRTLRYTVRGSIAALTDWYEAEPPTGYGWAQPTAAANGVTRIVLEPLDPTRRPAALLWVSMQQHGGQVLFREDGQAAWRVTPSGTRRSGPHG